LPTSNRSHGEWAKKISLQDNAALPVQSDEPGNDFCGSRKSCLGATDPQRLRGGSARPINSSPSETRSLHLAVTMCRPSDDTRGGIGDFWHKSANADGDVVCVEDLLHTVVVCQRHIIASLIFNTGKGSVCRPS